MTQVGTKSHLLRTKIRCLWAFSLARYCSTCLERVPMGSRASSTCRWWLGGRGRQQQRSGSRGPTCGGRVGLKEGGRVTRSPGPTACTAAGAHLNQDVGRVDDLVELAPDALGLARAKDPIANLFALALLLAFEVAIFLRHVGGLTGFCSLGQNQAPGCKNGRSLRGIAGALACASSAMEPMES